MSIEADVRDYLRSRPALMGMLNDDPERLNMDFRGNIKATHITLYLAGNPLHDYVPLGQPIITLHCYGTTRAVAADLADQAAWEIRRITQINAPLLSATVESVNYLPTSEGAARYIVTSVITARIGQKVAPG